MAARYAEGEISVEGALTATRLEASLGTPEQFEIRADHMGADFSYADQRGTEIHLKQGLNQVAFSSAADGAVSLSVPDLDSLD